MSKYIKPKFYESNGFPMASIGWGFSCDKHEFFITKLFDTVYNDFQIIYTDKETGGDIEQEFNIEQAKDLILWLQTTIQMIEAK
jgi:hypothetical protein